MQTAPNQDECSNTEDVTFFFRWKYCLCSATNQKQIWESNIPMIVSTDDTMKAKWWIATESIFRNVHTNAVEVQKSSDPFNKKSNVDDAQELTGWKKVSQFAYCTRLIFLHFHQAEPFSLHMSQCLDGSGN